jgi:hypothetical protein
VLSALWGKLAAEILMQQWEVALDDLTKLKEIIDANSFAPLLQQLQQRVWLMHWALFVFFEHENGRNAIIDLFFQDRRGPAPGLIRAFLADIAVLLAVHAQIFSGQHTTKSPGHVTLGTNIWQDHRNGEGEMLGAGNGKH